MNPTEQFRLDGKVALITGASSGIGATLARGFAQAGAHVVLAARRAERLDQLANELRESGLRASTVALDVTDRQSIAAAFDAAERTAGVVQILVNNAGVAEPKRFIATPRESLERTMATNFFGAWDMCQEAAKRLLAAQRPGSIINVASILALGAGVGYASYASSKAALAHLTRSLALEFARQGIRVNALAPGWFVSEMNDAWFASEGGRAAVARMPAGRTGELAELVGPALLLASDAGSFVNGVVLPVDGALTVALV